MNQPHKAGEREAPDDLLSHFAPDYRDALSALAKRTGMSPLNVLRAAVRLYQAECGGYVAVQFSRSLSMLSDPALSPTAPQEPATADAPAREGVAWREHVEQRLHAWRQRTMNRSGDHLALDDFMDKESIDDLIDFVCDEWSEPTPPQAPAQEPTSVHHLSPAEQESFSAALRKSVTLIRAPEPVAPAELSDDEIDSWSNATMKNYGAPYKALRYFARTVIGADRMLRATPPPPDAQEGPSHE